VYSSWQQCQWGPAQTLFDSAPGVQTAFPSRIDISSMSRAQRKDGTLWQKSVHERIPRTRRSLTGRLASTFTNQRGTALYAFFGSRGPRCALNGE